MNRRPYLAFVLVGALWLSACQASPPPSGGVAPAPTQAAEDDGQTSESQPTAAPPAEPTAEPDSGINLASIDTGLETLDSYRATFDASIEKTQAGETTTETIQWVEEYVREPESQRVVFAGSEVGEEVQIVRIENDTFFVTGDQCQSMTQQSDPGSLIPFSPSAYFGTITAQTAVGVESVNGVSAMHFRGDITTLGFAAGLTSADADLWVAQPGGYVVKYVFTGEGSGSLLFGGDPNTSGKMRIEYNVLEANRPITIAPPEGCESAGSEDIPLLPDATDVFAVGETTTYKTATPFADVVSFYEREMPTNGWTAVEGGLSAEGFTQLNFTKEGRAASVTITFDASSSASNVIISVTGE
jgi:hypothetical protein